MQGTVLYGPRDIRFEDRPEPKIIKADRCHHPPLGHMHLRIGPVAVSRHPADCCNRRRWVTSIAASWKRSAEKSGTSSRASSSSARLPRPTTLASSASTAISPRACNASS